MQVLKCIGEPFKVTLRQKISETSFNLGSIAECLVPFPALPQGRNNGILFFICSSKFIYFRVRNLVNYLRKITDSISIDGISKFNFGLDLVAFCYRNLSHVITEP